jgi:hypothetical protein
MELATWWKEAVAAKFKAILQHLPGGSDKTVEKPQ